MKFAVSGPPSPKRKSVKFILPGINKSESKNMKQILAITAMTILLCGCNPNQAATNKSSVEIQTNFYQEITGGFGWKLGQIVSTNQDCLYETNGVFSQIFLSINTNHQLCSVTAYTPINQPLSRDDIKALLKSLDQKYGYLGSTPSEDGTAYVFGESNSVIVYDHVKITEISYISHNLAATLKKQKEDEKVKTFSNY